MLFGLMLREAIASCALEHPRGCGCDTCLAAAGDTDAFARVWVAVQDEQSKRDAETDSPTDA